MYKNILIYKSGQYGGLAIILCALAILGYGFEAPIVPANGGTVYGFTSGIACAVVTIWMALLGWRKRAYKSRVGNLQGWVSAHVYLGCALLIVATLHTGFQFGWNIHALAYFSLLGLVLTGIVGVYGYLRFPRLLMAKSNYLSKERALEDLEHNNRYLITLAKKISPVCDQVIHSALPYDNYGGSLLHQLLKRDFSSVLIPSISTAPNNTHRPQIIWQKMPNKKQTALLVWLRERLVESQRQIDADNIKNLITGVAKRQKILEQLRFMIWTETLLVGWRWLHIPLTVMFIAALSIHIFSVLWYW